MIRKSAVRADGYPRVWPRCLWHPSQTVVPLAKRQSLKKSKRQILAVTVRTSRARPRMEAWSVRDHLAHFADVHRHSGWAGKCQAGLTGDLDLKMGAPGLLAATTKNSNRLGLELVLTCEPSDAQRKLAVQPANKLRAYWPTHPPVGQ